MAFNFGKLNNFELPEPGKPNFNNKLYEAPREIDLTPEEATSVNQIIDSLTTTGLTVNSLFKLFNEWQSNKTKSVKRFVLSFPFILTLTIVAGVNITDINLFGVSVQQGMATVFLSSLVIILIFSFVYYLYLQSKDWKLYLAKIDSVNDSLERCVNITEKIDEIINDNGIESVEYLFDDFKGTFDKSNSDIEAYNAIKFYKNKLKNTRKNFKRIETIEFVGICLLNLLGLAAIIISF
jgi:hypothetical protein